VGTRYTIRAPSTREKQVLPAGWSGFREFARGFIRSCMLP
jgi:hypothetical protein